MSLYDDLIFSALTCFFDMNFSRSLNYKLEFIKTKNRLRRTLNQYFSCVYWQPQMVRYEIVQLRLIPQCVPMCHTSVKGARTSLNMQIVHSDSSIYIIFEKLRFLPVSLSIEDCLLDVSLCLHKYAHWMHWIKF